MRRCVFAAALAVLFLLPARGEAAGLSILKQSDRAFAASGLVLIQEDDQDVPYGTRVFRSERAQSARDAGNGVEEDVRHRHITELPERSGEAEAPRSRATYQRPPRRQDPRIRRVGEDRRQSVRHRPARRTQAAAHRSGVQYRHRGSARHYVEQRRHHGVPRHHGAGSYRLHVGSVAPVGYYDRHHAARQAGYRVYSQQYYATPHPHYGHGAGHYRHRAGGYGHTGYFTRGGYYVTPERARGIKRERARQRARMHQFWGGLLPGYGHGWDSRRYRAYDYGGHKYGGHGYRGHGYRGHDYHGSSKYRGYDYGGRTYRGYEHRDYDHRGKYRSRHHGGYGYR